jgi:hypothetical protein
MTFSSLKYPPIAQSPAAQFCSSTRLLNVLSPSSRKGQQQFSDRMCFRWLHAEMMNGPAVISAYTVTYVSARKTEKVELVYNALRLHHTLDEAGTCDPIPLFAQTS